MRMPSGVKGFEPEFGGSVVGAAGKHFARLNGSDHHDVSLTAIGKDTAAINLRTQPLAAKIDVGEARPLLVGEVEEGHDSFDAGVVDQHVDGAEFAPNLIHHGFHVRALGDVGFNRHCTAALAADLGCHVFGGLAAIDIVHGDVGPLFGENFGYPSSNPAAGAGDERNFPMQSQCFLLTFNTQRPKCLRRLVGYAFACPRRHAAERRAVRFAW
jgi:hypothetical protein